MFGNPLDTMLSQFGQNRSNAPAGSPTPTSPLGGSFFSAASPITAGASSIGASPFGALIPDLSRATPEQRSFISDTLSHLTYDLPAGGYIDNTKNYGNTVFGPGGYYNREVRLPSEPQRQASDVYNLIGGLPTRPLGTQALNQLPGYNPSSGPSFNTQFGRPYSGPFAFPNFRG